MNDDDVTFTVSVTIKVRAKSVDGAAEIFVNTSGARILRDCDRYTICASKRDLEKAHRAKAAA